MARTNKNNNTVEKTRIDMQSSNKRFNSIIEEVKTQGGSVSGFIIEAVLFRENYLKMNRNEISQHLDVNLYSECPTIQNIVASTNNTETKYDNIDYKQEISSVDSVKDNTKVNATCDEQVQEDMVEGYEVEGLEAYYDVSSMIDEDDDL